MRGRFLAVPLIVAVSVLVPGIRYTPRRVRALAIPAIFIRLSLAPHPTLAYGRGHGLDIDSERCQQVQAHLRDRRREVVLLSGTRLINANR